MGATPALVFGLQNAITNEYQTVGINDPGDDELITVFENGIMVKIQDFSEIRERSKL